MTKPVTPEHAGRLAGAAAQIELELRAGPAEPPKGSGFDAMREHGQACNLHAVKILERLRDENGARVEIGGVHQAFGNGCTMSYLGVRSTCTSGPSGLLRNWIHAARRKAGWEDL